MKEVWKNIENYEGLYQVSNMGRVRSLTRIDARKHMRVGIILKGQVRNGGYTFVHLSKNGKCKWYSVHRLVATAFIDKEDGKDIVNHLDNNPNNNNAENLEWTDFKGNMQHASKQGRMHYNPENLQKALESRKKPVIAYKDDKKLFFESAMDAERFGFNHRHIASCCNNKYGYKTHKGYKWRYADA